MTVVDVHAHFVAPAVLARCVPRSVLAGWGSRPFEPPPPDSPRAVQTAKMTQPDAMLADMDAQGIDVQLLSSSLILQSTAWAEPNEQAQLERMVNDECARWVALRPQRFAGSFTLPLRNMKLALAEIEYATEQLGLGVANLPAQVDDDYLGGHHFAPMWEALEARRIPVLVHPDGIRDVWFQNYSLWNSIGQPIEEAKLMASLILEGVLDRHPSLQIIVSHGGGYLPHYFGRLDRNVTNMPDSVRNISARPSEYLTRFFYDTCVYDISILDALIDRVGAERIVMGSDYPVGESDPVGFVASSLRLDDAQRTAVCGGTAAALLGL